VIWLSWRQQRTETLIVAVMLALIAALLVPTGIDMASRYDHDGLSACAAASSAGGCGEAIEAFTGRFDWVVSLIPWLNLIPGVIGIALAAPLLLELESGTYRLAWTQSITRRRWLAFKLGTTALAAVVAALAMIALVTWWRMPLDHLHGRMETNVFDFEGTVGVGYVLFALGLSLAVGAVWRRTVPALITGFAGYTVVRIFVQNWLRERFEAPLTSTWPARSGFSTPKLDKAWVLELRPSDRLGHTIAQPLSPRPACARTIEKGVQAIDPSCLPRNLFNHAVYQPASRFWLFQGIETALFAGTAVVLILFAAWWVHERTS
jgi:hypothetical protein